MNTDNEIDVGLDTLSIKGDPTKLYEALAKAQSEFLPVPKASTGQIGQQKFKYAGYAKLMRCVRPALTANGIAIIQPLHSREDMAVTTTILAGHGASIISSFSFKAEFSKKTKDGQVIDDPQEFGRHHTYYRRYQLQAMLGIEGDADADDLPDVNEEPTQYAEHKSSPVAATPPKAEASVEKKPAAVKEQKTNGSAKPSAPSTPVESVKTVNERILVRMKQLGWKMPEVKAFYVEHVNPEGFDKADNLTIEQKNELLNKLTDHTPAA
jgi:ERF superfamily